MEPASRLGFNLVVMELQNHGRSERHSGGSSWGCWEKYDVIAVLNDLKRIYPEKEVMITGTSMGTISTTMAAIADPSAFSNVRTLVYESPIGNLLELQGNVAKSIGIPDSLRDLMSQSALLLSKFRVDYDLYQCLATEPGKTVEIPTLIMASMEEYKAPHSWDFINNLPLHSNRKVLSLKRGSHSAYWNYEPLVFEKNIKDFWQQHGKP